MKRIFLVLGLLLSLGSFCFADVSPFMPQWQIGDTWEINYYTRHTAHLDAAWELPVRRLGEFRTPKKFELKVMDKKIIRGEECFAVEMPLWKEKVIIYYRVSDLRIIFSETLNEDNTVISDRTYSESLILSEMVMSNNFPFSWPDFCILNQSEPVKMIGTTRQEVKVNGDTLTVVWKELYNDKDGSCAGTTTQIWPKGSKWWSKYWVEGNDGEDGKEGQWNVLEKAELVSDIVASINIEPDTLNLRSQGRYITCYIELPKEYRPEDIDIDSILLNDVVACESSPTSYPDSDKNGIRELMVKFDREEVIALLSGEGEEKLTITGKLKSGQSFNGEDKIKVVGKRPRVRGRISACKWYDREKRIVYIDLTFEPKGTEKIRKMQIEEIKTSPGLSYDPTLSPPIPFEIPELTPIYNIGQKLCFQVEPGIRKIKFIVKGTCQDEKGQTYNFKFGQRYRVEKIKDFQEDIVPE